MITMLIVDDEYYIRLGIRKAIDWNSIGVQIVGEAEDGEQGLEQALKLQPDIILMDIRMPFMDGLELMAKLKEHGLDCGIIVLSGHDEFKYAQMAIKNGVLDYLLKPIEKDKLKETVLEAGKAIIKKRSTKKYQQLISEETAAIRTQFIRDLILGNITSEAEFLQKTASLDIPLGQGCCQCICIRLDEYPHLERQLDIEQLRALKDTITALLSEHLLLGHSFLGMMADLSPDEWGVILAYLDKAGIEERKEELRQNISRIISGLDNIAPYTVSISTGGLCDTFSEISESYQKARMSNKKFIPGSNSIVYYDSSEIEGIRPEVQDAVSYIKQHFNEDITIQAVAGKLYLSPSYLMHIFKNDLGKTFNTVLTEYRLEMAKELLEQSGSRVYEIAMQVGYQDVKYFIKIFKRYTGVTPRDYVRLHYAER